MDEKRAQNSEHENTEQKTSINIFVNIQLQKLALDTTREKAKGNNTPSQADYLHRSGLLFKMLKRLREVCKVIKDILEIVCRVLR